MRYLLIAILLVAAPSSARTFTGQECNVAGGMAKEFANMRDIGVSKDVVILTYSTIAKNSQRSAHALYDDDSQRFYRIIAFIYLHPDIESDDAFMEVYHRCKADYLPEEKR
jgi:hypothetical protein